MATTTSDYVRDLVLIERWLSDPARVNQLALLLEKWRTEGKALKAAWHNLFHE